MSAHASVSLLQSAEKHIYFYLGEIYGSDEEELALNDLLTAVYLQVESNRK